MCKVWTQIRPDKTSGPKKDRALSGSKLFDTLMVFQYFFSKRVILKEKSADAKKAWTITLWSYKITTLASLRIFPHEFGQPHTFVTSLGALVCNFSLFFFYIIFV